MSVGDVLFFIVGMVLLGVIVGLVFVLFDNSIDRMTFEGIGPSQVRVTHKGVATVYTCDGYRWYSPSGEEVAYTAFDIRLGQAMRTWRYKTAQLNAYLAAHMIAHDPDDPGRGRSHEEHLRAHAEVLRD